MSVSSSSFVPDMPPANWADVMSQYRSTSKTIRVACWSVVVASVACAVIFSVVLCLRSSILWERRVLLLTVVNVVLLGFELILCVSRKEPVTLVIFTVLTAIVTGVCMGQTMCYV